MKRIILILVLALLSLGLKAQPQEYDTIIYYPPAVLNCPMWMDSVALFDSVDPSGYYSIFFYYQLMHIMCGTNIKPIPLCQVIGPNDSTLNIRAFAQPYHLDSSVLVIGVAAKVSGTKPALGGYSFFRLMDSTTQLASVIVPALGSDSIYNVPTWRRKQGKYYFNNQIMLKDFYIAVDMPSIYEYKQGGTPYEFDHTVTFTDTSCLKIDRGCYQDEPPYLMKNNQWIRFDNDSVYWYYRKMHIGWFPIILVPRTSSLTEVELANTCNVFPNPATNILKILSQFKVDKIEIYDMSGLRIKSIEINSHEGFVDISDYKEGVYIVKLHTIRGIITKKIIKG